jgi:chaperonin GroES
MALNPNSNIAGDLSEEVQVEIAQDVIQNWRTDHDSRSDWEEKRNRWYELAICTPPKRELPWEGAANVCVPMLASAVQQFQARAYAALFAQPFPERLHAIPVEPTDAKVAKDVEHFMNWQLIVEMTEYETEFDRMLMELPIYGTTFKKTFWCTKENRPKSMYVPAADVYLPYKTAELKNARRVIQRKPEHMDEIMEAARGENPFYVNTEDLKAPGEQEARQSLAEQTSDMASGETVNESAEIPNMIFEAYVNRQLSGDSRPQPYTFWVDRSSRTLLRAVSRRTKVGATNEVLFPWTDYHFIPNPEGFYSFGYGMYLEQLNCMINSVFNQYLDAGKLTNAPMVFYGRTAGIKKRRIKVTPGGAEQVNDFSQLLIWKFPGLDQSLPLLIQEMRRMAEDLTSNTEEIQGRAQKGVREPTVGGTLARIEQGLVSFGVITKRVFRQQALEFRHLFKLNSLFLDEEKQFRVLGSTSREPFSKIKRADFNRHFDIFPTGDPSFASPQQRRAEAAQIMEVALQHPLIAGIPDAGQPGNQAAQLAILRDYLQTFDKGELLHHIPEPPDPSLPPDVENAMFMQGDFVAPKQGEPHAEHLAQHLEFLASAEFARLPLDRQDLLRRHIDLTQSIQVLEQQQAATAARAAANGGANGAATA